LGVILEPLGKQHDRPKFSCGQAELDDWFRRRAGQDERRNVAPVFVAVDSELGVIGFYSLSSFKLDFDDLPEEIAHKLPRYDGVPAALIGRLARDARVRRKGLGELLVADALRRVRAPLNRSLSSRSSSTPRTSARRHSTRGSASAASRCIRTSCSFWRHRRRRRWRGCKYGDKRFDAHLDRLKQRRAGK
jgi:hypothetical protein